MLSYRRERCRARYSFGQKYKSAISLQRGQFDPKFQVEGPPTNHSSSQKTRLNDL